MNNHDIYIDWELSGPNPYRPLLTRVITAALAAEGVQVPCGVDVLLTTDEGIREINREQRAIDAATDVLSFPMGENGNYDVNHETGAKILGDIVISVPKAMEQAKTYGHSFEREMGFLTAHSMLHLLGYDHEAGGLARVRMREKEEQVMRELGLPASASYATTPRA